ncbi:MAG: DUF2164 domain-containing protein [Pseudomonadota bacterium]
MTIKLQKEVEARLLGSLQRYHRENCGDSMGDLQAKLMLDFILREIGPAIYNQAVADAQTAIESRIAELDVDCYEQEYGYWKK